MKNIIKKISVVLLSMVLILPMFTFVGCMPELEYHVELQLQAPGVIAYESLTPDSPNLEVYGGEMVYDAGVIRPIIEIKGGSILHEERVVERISLHGKDNENIDYDLSYEIVDNEGNATYASLSRVDMELTAEQIDKGFICLEDKIGVHHLKYTINSVDGYEIEPVIFSIKIGFIESRATEYLRYELSQNSSAVLLMSADQTKTYDIYKVSSIPVFYAYNVETGYKLYDNADIRCRKLSENYYWESPSSTFNRGNGIYLCEVTYSKSDEYYPNRYRFYAIYVGD